MTAAAFTNLDDLIGLLRSLTDDSAVHGGGVCARSSRQRETGGDEYCEKNRTHEFSP